MFRKISQTILTLVLTAGVVGSARAQQFGDPEGIETNAPPYYYYFKPGEVTKKVTIWGDVRYPGLYQVNEATDLNALMALSGGPLMTETMRGYRKKVMVHHYRMDASGNRTLVFSKPIAEVVSEPGRHAPLNEGDLVMIETIIRRTMDWRDVFTVMGGLGGLGVGIASLINVAR